MEKISEVTCVNCGLRSSSNFCGNCGQKTAVRQLKWGTLFDELNQRLLGLDNKFAKTIRDLTVRPDAVIGTFIEGNRVKYIGPVGYFFILVTIYVLVISLLEIDMVKFTQGTKELFGQSEADLKSGEGFQRFLMGHMKVMTFVVMPFFILATYLLFLKKGYNIIESAVVVFYAHAHTMTLTLINLVLYKITNAETNTYIMPISLLYIGFAYAKFYEGNKIWSFIKGILSYVLGILFVMILAMIVMLLLVFIDPELAKQVLQLKP